METRTNIVLDDKLVAKAMKRAGVKTKKAAVEAALQAYVAKPDYSGLMALRGSGAIADDYDPKAYEQRKDGVTDPKPKVGALLFVVKRGSSWYTSDGRAANRSYGFGREARSASDGFRLCCTLD